MHDDRVLLFYLFGLVTRAEIATEPSCRITNSTSSDSSTISQTEHYSLLFNLSGMSINHWTVPARLPSKPGSLDWSRIAPLKYQEPPGKQARPLVDMSIRVVAKNIGIVSKELLETIPPRVLWRLWRFLEARGGACLHAWRIFSEVLTSDDEEDQVLAARLFVCGFYYAHYHLWRLHVYSIMASFPHVSDRIVRGWSDAPDPFPLLRVLRIWGDQSVTEVSLRWVAKFPSLVLYDVMAGKDDWTSAYEEAETTGWTVSQQVTRAEDTSILRYLMLLAPGEEIPMNRFSDLSRGIDVDLINLSSDPRCVLKRVPHGGAPPLLDYLMDPAKVSMQQANFLHKPAPKEVKFCHETAFETWAFWLYSLIGQLSGDRDLRSRGVRPEEQTVAGPFVLPSKPMACLFLGHSGQGGISSKPSYISRGLFATKRFTFTRLEILKGVIPPNTRAATGSANTVPAPPRRQPPSVKHNKRRRMEDVLGSFG
ncbi:hypothetical protein LMH87_005846 [Akanthomyces muscarius]|uniref:Uncharacterized protein n=1 Tax=Akanthomyces muscarius TaxID=2231603 RepID=A0A9W8QLJ5_AKAMU|nr:hypothetical protein LMH87_005846 [Akanthomyces muscarius]KAJ4164161.1 hypothetical protein LMH87_005846 [Akanthomyces muscarius]